MTSHTFSTGLKAALETQLVCSTDRESSALTPGIPTLCIKDQVSGSDEHIPLEKLKNMFPFQDQLNLSAHNIARTLASIREKLKTRDKEIAAGKNPLELPDHEQLVRKLYHEDIIKWIEFYLQNKTI